RYVIEDGRLPIEMARLPSSAVPAQNLFFIDGDGSVPALFLSKIFEVWARATLTRSSSWSARFSLGKTFETFPIPPDFVVSGLHRESQPHLHLAGKARGIDSIAKELQRRIEKDGSLKRSSERGSVFARLDAALLAAYQLHRRATNFEI